MKPTLNQADIELLKSTLATKEDLKAFATREEMNAKFEELEGILASTFEELEKRYDQWFGKIEKELGVDPAN